MNIFQRKLNRANLVGEVLFGICCLPGYSREYHTNLRHMSTKALDSALFQRSDLP